MTDPTPISPPPSLPPNGAPLGDGDNGPISPVSVSRTSTFPHKTSPAVSTQTPLIDTATPAINSVPVELDGVARSEQDLMRRGTGESSRSGLENGSGSGSGVLSPADEEDIDAEFLGEGRTRVSAREKRAAILASRSKDPSVIVDVPQDPTAEEVEAAKSAEGMVTPGLNAEDGLPKTLGGAR